MVNVPTVIDARGLLRTQFKISYDLLEGTIADCTREIANTWRDGWTTHPISAIYLHTVCSDDYMVNEVARGAPRLYEAEGWEQRLGVQNMIYIEGMPPGSITLDTGIVREYAAAVRATAERFLDDASETELTRLVNNYSGGQCTVGEYLASYAVTHLNEHCGEIAALKGVLGLKGLPF